VVNGGGHEADEVVKSFIENKHNVEVILVNTINKNLATSRNIGLDYFEGDILAMTDDDAQVFHDWVTQIKKQHQQHPEAGGIGGPVFGDNDKSLVGKVADLNTFPRWDKPIYTRTLPGVNIAYKKEALEKVGYQDETLFRGEDVDFNWRIKKAGYEIFYHPNVKVYHYHRPDLKGYLNQHYMYGRAYYLVRDKWRDMYCIYPHRFNSVKSFLKAINVVAGIIYMPFFQVKRLPTLKDKIKAIPLLMLCGFEWRRGMLVQKLASLKKH
jgi:GT2 family glycosyltransferase